MDIPKIIIEDDWSRDTSSNSKSVRHKILAVILILISLIMIGVTVHQVFLPGVKSPMVKTALGEIRGISINRLGKPMSLFLGVPYAKPPIGENRFKKPQKIDTWSPNVIHAVKQPPACIQLMRNRPSLDSKVAKQSEDCLYMNIYVPGYVNPKYTSPSKLKPVVIWIHGGAFYFGSVSSYDPSPMAAMGDVIIVSISYRLGIFGFMMTTKKDRSEIPGNMGLHDQVLAIRFVRQHIRSFGGDPYQITLMGESAGAISVGFHMISPHSRKLFNRAILQSGSPLTPVMMIGNENGPILIEKISSKLDCPYLSRRDKKYATFSPETYMCIRNATIIELLDIQLAIIKSKRSSGFHPTTDFDFFPKHPYDMIKSMSPFGIQKEILIGTTANEGAAFMASAMPKLFPKHGDIARNITPEVILDKVSKSAPEEYQAASKTYLRYVFDFMFGGLETGNSSIIVERMDKMLGNSIFLCPNIALIDSFLALKDNSAYVYQFNARPENVKNYKWVKGALHHEEMQFIFGQPLLSDYERQHSSKHHPGDMITYTQDEVNLSRKIMTDWINFIKFGKPNDNWTPCKGEDERSYFEYVDSKTCQINDGLPENRCHQYFDMMYEQAKGDYNYFATLDDLRK